MLTTTEFKWEATHGETDGWPADDSIIYCAEYGEDFFLRVNDFSSGETYAYTWSVWNNGELLEESMRPVPSPDIAKQAAEQAVIRFLDNV